MTDLCLVLLQGQNNFCLGQNKFVPDKIIFVIDKNFCTRLKSSDQPFFMTKEFCTRLKSRFLIEKSHFQGLFMRKNGLFSHGQNFCPGQKIFCPGRWTGHMEHIERISQLQLQNIIVYIIIHQLDCGNPEIIWIS